MRARTKRRPERDHLGAGEHEDGRDDAANRLLLEPAGGLGGFGGTHRTAPQTDQPPSPRWARTAISIS